MRQTTGSSRTIVLFLEACVMLAGGTRAAAQTEGHARFGQTKAMRKTRRRVASPRCSPIRQAPT